MQNTLRDTDSSGDDNILNNTHNTHNTRAQGQRKYSRPTTTSANSLQKQQN